MRLLKIRCWHLITIFLLDEIQTQSDDGYIIEEPLYTIPVWCVAFCSSFPSSNIFYIYEYQGGMITLQVVYWLDDIHPFRWKYFDRSRLVAFPLLISCSLSLIVIYFVCLQCGFGRPVAPIKLVLCSVGRLEPNSPCFLIFPRDGEVLVL